MCTQLCALASVGPEPGRGGPWGEGGTGRCHQGSGTSHLYSYGLYSYGLHSYGLHCYGLRSYGLRLLPPGIGYLTSLLYLDVSENYLVDLPFGMSKLTGITDVNIAENEIRRLEPTLSFCTWMVSLDFTTNPPDNSARAHHIIAAIFGDILGHADGKCRGLHRVGGEHQKRLCEGRL